MNAFLWRRERRFRLGRLARPANLFPGGEPGINQQRSRVYTGGRAFYGSCHLRETGENFYFGKDAVDTKVRYFELTMWPHMRAAYNLARWLVRNDQDAEDIVQESFLKAYKAQESFRGSEAKTWMLIDRPEYGDGFPAALQIRHCGALGRPGTRTTGRFA